MRHIGDNDFTTAESILVVAGHTGTWMAAAALLGLMMYFIFNHRESRRHAESLEVSVEGAFLCIRRTGSETSDRRIHFRAIVDYTCYQSRLMRFAGIHSIRMTTTAGGPGALVAISGIKNALKVRDMLSEIDSLRENR